MKSVLILALATATSGAQALDCVAPDLATSFTSADCSFVDFVVGLGRLSFDTSRLPGDGQLDDAEFPPIPGQFVGKSLTMDGFETEPNVAVIVQPICAGSWCGGVPNLENEVIAFLQVIDGSFWFEVLPCGGRLFDADAASVAIVTACMRGETCMDLP